MYKYHFSYFIYSLLIDYYLLGNEPSSYIWCHPLFRLSHSLAIPCNMVFLRSKDHLQIPLSHGATVLTLKPATL